MSMYRCTYNKLETGVVAGLGLQVDFVQFTPWNVK